MRRDDWQTFLHDLVEAKMAEPFAWGSQDCVTFAAACIEAVTGSNPIAGIESWSTERQALRRIVEMGGIEAWLDERYPRVQWHEAQRGDVALMEQKAGLVVVVNIGPGWVGPSETGLTTSPPDAVQISWRVE